MISVAETKNVLAPEAYFKIDYSRVYFMFSLPRSRTQWCTRFISQAPNVPHAWHDPLAFCRSPYELVAKIDEVLRSAPPEQRIFIADTAAVMFYNRLTTLMPEMNVITMSRSMESVRHSLRKQVGRRMDFMVGPCNDRLQEIADDQTRRGNFHQYRFEEFGALQAQSLWHHVTGGRPIAWGEISRFVDRVIDVPIARQPHNPSAVAELLRHREVIF